MQIERRIVVETRIFYPQQDHNAIAEAAEIIRGGGLLGIPTETVYGLGANALNEDAVRRIFEAKGRPQDNPLIIHVPNDVRWLERYCHDVPETAYALAEKFWPGPLTMILPRRESVPLRTTGGLETVGVRCPNHPVTLAIIEASGVPIAAPSGNTSGRPSPTTAAHMIEDMDGKIDGIVDGGACAVGVESTIIDLTVQPPRLLRPGGLPLEALEAVLGEVTVDKAVTGKLTEGEKPRAPGMKYRHYAPKAPVTVVTGQPFRSAEYIRAHLGEHDGVICFDEFAPLFAGHIIHCLGPAADKSEQARRVFDALRTFDDTAVPAIFAQCPDESGLGLAIGNRLKKAAGFHVVDAGRPMVIGITGGTGAGKTSALRALERLGGCILDCDAIYHEMLRTDVPLRTAIIDAFGDVFTPEGTLDRLKLGNVVFADPKALDRLNEIIYFHLPRELNRRIALTPAGVVGIDAINLFESGCGAMCDMTVGITAPAEVRIRRIMQRDNISEEYARLRVSAQKSDDFYKENCTAVLMNADASSTEFGETAYRFFQKAIHDFTSEGECRHE
ncbi:MAG: threonylcarbamoyl-AMP synthase [Clostridiales bacterium]|nr:threonylcarbamoyl-AMP synthase [Candidatus Cacconaster stercorequi]